MEPSDVVVKFKPEIVENYKDFEPPERFRTLVDQLLLAVPPHYLAGLKTIVLTNQSALTRDQRRQKIWGRRRMYRLAEVRGAYYEATRSRPASVLLLVDNVVKGLPPWVAAYLLRRNLRSSVSRNRASHSRSSPSCLRW
jgi:hypothetical protein